MRARLIAAAIVILAVIAAIAGVRSWQANQTTASAPPAGATPALSPLPSSETPAAVGESPASNASPQATQTPAPAVTPTPSATPTIPAEPTGLKPGWEKKTERVSGGREADLVARTGDIDNLGFGWPKNFTPFSGKSTPVHPWPCQPRPGSAPGTDRVMLGSAVTADDFKTRLADGYSRCSTRPDNLPVAIPIELGALPPKIRIVLLQMFVDDFQAPVFKSHFQVSLNGTRIPTFEETINALDQTGPIGKLVTLRLLPEYFRLLRSGTVDLFIDDPTTHAPDAYAVNFARLLVNPHAFQYAVTIACTVVDAATQKPIAGATVTSAQVTAETGAAGKCALRGVPAGMVSVSASAVGYDSAVQLLDLPVGTPGVANFALKRHHEGVSDLQQQLEQSGSVAIYGIHFDTASAKLRPDSVVSLETVLQLVKGRPRSHWVIAGHTDNQGGAAYNLALSDARAKSVVAWLAEHGIPKNRLTAQGFGLTRPVADNGTDSGRALNRRVEVKLVK